MDEADISKVGDGRASVWKTVAKHRDKERGQERMGGKGTIGTVSCQRAEGEIGG